MEPRKSRAEFPKNPACRGEDTELFYLRSSKVEKIAKEICARCVSKESCLAWALENDERDGIWGGLNENERLALKRRHKRSIV